MGAGPPVTPGSGGGTDPQRGNPAQVTPGVGARPQVTLGLRGGNDPQCGPVNTRVVQKLHVRLGDAVQDKRKIKKGGASVSDKLLNSCPGTSF